MKNKSYEQQASPYVRRLKVGQVVELNNEKGTMTVAEIMKARGVWVAVDANGRIYYPADLYLAPFGFRYSY